MSSSPHVPHSNTSSSSHVPHSNKSPSPHVPHSITSPPPHVLTRMGPPPPGRPRLQRRLPSGSLLPPAPPCPGLLAPAHARSTPPENTHTHTHTHTHHPDKHIQKHTQRHSLKPTIVRAVLSRQALVGQTEPGATLL